jgi:hypothetical protein
MKNGRQNNNSDRKRKSASANTAKRQSTRASGESGRDEHEGTSAGRRAGANAFGVGGDAGLGSAQRTAEAAATVAVATAEEVAEEEGEGDDQGVLSVTPDVETRVEITQTPLKGRSLFQKFLYGK